LRGIDLITLREGVLEPGSRALGYLILLRTASLSEIGSARAASPTPANEGGGSPGPGIGVLPMEPPKNDEDPGVSGQKLGRAARARDPSDRCTICSERGQRFIARNDGARPTLLLSGKLFRVIRFFRSED
jgi:hypothetical protein